MSSWRAPRITSPCRSVRPTATGWPPTPPRTAGTGPPGHPALLQGIITCGTCGRRMTVRYHQRRGQLLPNQVCQRDGIEHARRICQAVPAAGWTTRIGQQLTGTLTPLTAEAAVTVQAPPPRPPCATRPWACWQRPYLPMGGHLRAWPGWRSAAAPAEGGREEHPTPSSAGHRPGSDQDLTGAMAESLPSRRRAAGACSFAHRQRVPVLPGGTRVPPRDPGTTPWFTRELAVSLA